MAHDITTIPNIQVDFIDPRTGRMDRAWRMFFENLWKLQGSGTTDITVEDLQKSPQFEPPIPFPDDVSPPQSVIQIPEDVLPPTPQLGTIASYNLDGSPTAGGVSYGTGPAIAVTPAGTLGQVLTSAAAATPTWTTPTVGTVTDVAALTLGTTGTDLSSTVANGTTTPVITLQVPTASAANRGALSSTDWTTFNNKQAALSSMYVAQAFTAQTTIVVTHNFGKYPVVDVINNTGQIVIPFDVTHNSVNDFTVNFYLATTGNIIAVIGY